MTINVFANLPDEIKNTGLLRLTDFNKYFTLFTADTLRQFEFNDKYGFKKVVTRIGGRVFIKLEEFQNWLVEQDKASA